MGPAMLDIGGGGDKGAGDWEAAGVGKQSTGESRPYSWGCECAVCENWVADKFRVGVHGCDEDLVKCGEGCLTPGGGGGGAVI